MDFQILLWIGVALGLIYAAVSSVLYKTKIDPPPQVDGRHVAGKLLSELQDKFSQGSDELVDVYQLGMRLGFSHDQIRAALSEFKKDEQVDVLVFGDRHVKLGIRGQMMCRPEDRTR